MNAMHARHHLAEQGYVFLYNAVPEDSVNNLRAVARHDELAWNNGSWDGEAFDTFRPSAPLPDALSRVMTTTFRRHYMTFFPQTSATTWRFLLTRAGARDQPVRRDFAPPLVDIHAADPSAFPAQLLVATQDGTVLYGYGWNRLVAFRSNAETIRLNKGDMIMFRGDFIYSPAGYETNNLCLRGCLDTPLYMRDLEGDEPELVAVFDDTSFVDDLFYYVYNCSFIASGTTSLRKHLDRFHGFLFGRPRPHDA